MDIHLTAGGLLGAPREAARTPSRPGHAAPPHRRASLELRHRGAVHHQRQRHYCAGGATDARRAATLVVRAARTLTESGTLQIGDLVEFAKATTPGAAPQDRSTSLGLVEQADKKIVLQVVDTSSSAEKHAQQVSLRKATITARQVVFRMPGGPFTEEHLRAFAAVAAQQAKEATLQSQGGAGLADGPVPPGDDQAAPSPLAAAWELAVADHIKSLTLSELAGLMLDDESPLSLYRLYRSLITDRLYFRQVGGKSTVLVSLEQVAFEPRAPAAVEAMRLQMAAEQAAREDEAAWSLAVRAALAARRRADQPSPEQWQGGRHARRISALKALAVQDVAPISSETLKLAQASLALAGIVPPSASAPASTTGSATSASPLAEAATNLLVDVRAWRRHEPVSALRRGVQLKFPESVEREAQAVLESPPQDTCSSIRVDLTRLRCYTIDDQGTSEVDDGLSVEVLGGGRQEQQQDGATSGSAAAATQEEEEGEQGAVRVWVHVADPTRWLVPGSQLLEEARVRARSLYFPWGNVPMFPRSLSAPFSLRHNQESCALSVGLTLRPDGSVRDVSVVPSRVVATHALTYDQADALLVAASQGAGGEVPGSLKATAAGGAAVGGQQQQLDALAARDLVTLRSLADARRAYREGKGCIEIPLPEVKVAVAESQLDAGRPNVQLKRLSQWDSPSRGLVAEMMILAGEAIGRLGATQALPLPYRMQPAPLLPPAEELEAIPEGACRGYRLRRCMTRSGVSAVPQPHASLGLDAYVQVTSPIRRWADILAHFNLKAWLLGTPRPFSAADVEAINQATSSDRVREGGVAERMEESYWITEFFRQMQSNKSAPHQWLATVLGWQREESRLAAVLLDEYGLEAVVKVDVEVSPGDKVQLALLEARPVAGVLRFFVSEYVSVSSPYAEEGDEADEEERLRAAYDSLDDGRVVDGDASVSSSSPAAESPLSAQTDLTFVQSSSSEGTDEAPTSPRELALC